MFLRKDLTWQSRSKTQRTMVEVPAQDLVQLEALVRALDVNDVVADRLRRQIEQILAGQPESVDETMQAPFRLLPTQH